MDVVDQIAQLETDASGKSTEPVIIQSIRLIEEKQPEKDPQGVSAPGVLDHPSVR